MSVFLRKIEEEGLTFTIEKSTIPSDRTRFLRFIITAVYDDYMESDPILRYEDINMPPSHEIRINLRIDFDHEKADKRITKLNIYVSNNPEEITDLEDWIEDFSQFFFKDSVTTEEATVEIEFDGRSDLFERNLLDTLGRAPRIEGRSRVKARYIARSQRQQGSVVVIDDGDRSLSLSTYSGAGVHEDENFVSVRVDNLGNPQQIPLNGRGELLGLEVQNDKAFAFRETEVEVVDLYSGVLNIDAIDFLSRKSLLKTPYGLVWGGKAGIYFLPVGQAGFILINDSWKNLFDGSIRDTLGLPEITHEDRKNLISGYDPFNLAAWLHFPGKATFRYHFKDEGIWSVREAEDARFFMADEQGFLIIGTEEGLFRYPLLGGNLRFHYEVSFDGESSEGGVPYTMLFNFGSIYNINAALAPYEIILDYEGESESGEGYFEVRFYANDDETPYETKRFRVDQRPSPRGIPTRGQLEQLRIEIEIPDEEDNLEDVRHLDISQVNLGFTAKHRAGQN